MFCPCKLRCEHGNTEEKEKHAARTRQPPDETSRYDQHYAEDEREDPTRFVGEPSPAVFHALHSYSIAEGELQYTPGGDTAVQKRV